jgi:uncharacterized OsmC-like protein
MTALDERNAMERIQQALQDARAYLEGHPDEARYTDSAAVATLFEGLRVGVTGPGGEAALTDMPQSVGGGGTASSPGWLFRAAMASCTATLIAMRAAQVGVPISELTVTVESESDDRGILGIQDGVPAGPLEIRVFVRLRAEGVDPGDLQNIARWGLDHCPVVDAAERAVPVELLFDSAD